jgi:hypothetical protein
LKIRVSHLAVRHLFICASQHLFFLNVHGLTADDCLVQCCVGTMGSRVLRSTAATPCTERTAMNRPCASCLLPWRCMLPGTSGTSSRYARRLSGCAILLRFTFLRKHARPLGLYIILFGCFCPACLLSHHAVWAGQMSLSSSSSSSVFVLPPCSSGSDRGSWVLG